MSPEDSESRERDEKAMGTQGVTYDAFKATVLGQRLKVDGDSQVYARELLDTSRSNLRSCRLLYEQSQYADSIFMLQQSAEKVNKSFLLWTGTLSMRDLKYVGHDAFEAADLVLEKGESLSSFMKNFAPQPEGCNTVTISGESVLEVARASEASILETIAKSEESARGYYSNITGWLKAENAAGRIKGDAKRRVGALDLLSEMAVSYSACVAITHYTCVHAVRARYPGKLGPKDYTPSLGIVAATPALAHVVERAISAVDRLMSRNPGDPKTMVEPNHA